jgi:hypothetical protein
VVDIYTHNDLVKNVCVYGLAESVKASKYPMAVDTEQCTDEITGRTRSLATCEKGSGHDQFLTGIIVQFDLTLSIKAWVEAERYHWLDFVSSQSTMHRVSMLDIDKQCNGYVTENTKRELQRLKDAYNADKTPENYLRVLYNVPAGFTLTARMTTNYRQLKTICSQRKNHRLPEWRRFCKWIETLPHSEFIVG